MLILTKDSFDVYPYVSSLCKALSPTASIERISLGRGQEISAERSFDTARLRGHWLLLENVYLVPHSIEKLETIIRKPSNKDIETDDNFRVIIVTRTEAQIPLEIVQNSIKIACEKRQSRTDCLAQVLSSKNVKDIFEKNMQRKNIISRMFDYCTIFCILRDRLRYGHYGWNVAYDFDESDLMCGLGILEVMSDKGNGENSVEGLRCDIGEISLGAKITDPWDLRRLSGILTEFRRSGEFPYMSSTSDMLGQCQANDLNFVDKQMDFMNSNQENRVQMQENNRFLNDLRGNLNYSFAYCSDSNEEIVRDMISLIIKKLPFKIDISSNLTQSSPIHASLLEEIEALNKLLDTVIRTTEYLTKSMNGLNIITPSLEEVLRDILKGKVPTCWSINGFQRTTILANWIENIVARAIFIRSWTANSMPTVFWLGGVAFPKRFLTAIKQMHAKQYKVPLADICFQLELEVNSGLLNEKVCLCL